MRKYYEEVLRGVFYRELFRRRVELGISQEEMAHVLTMGCRSYIDLEHGKNGCSGLTLARYLIYVCNDPKDFLEELRDAFEKRDSGAA